MTMTNTGDLDFDPGKADVNSLVKDLVQLSWSLHKLETHIREKQRKLADFKRDKDRIRANILMSDASVQQGKNAEIRAALLERTCAEDQDYMLLTEAEDLEESRIAEDRIEYAYVERIFKMTLAWLRTFGTRDV